jgi:hypothetical protein
MAGREYPNGLPWNGEDDYGVFRSIPVDVSDGKNQDVGFIVVDKAGNKIGTNDDRFANPSVTPEIWLRPDSAEIFTSQAAAQGFVTVHYSRPDGAYDGWGLHVFGDAAAPGAETQWTSPRPPDGTDEFGPFWQVPVDDVDAELGFIIHKGDEKDPGPDQKLIPSQQASAWIVSGDETVHETRAAALDLAVLHYNRPAGDYGDYTSTDYTQFWGLHTWTGSANPTQWPAPLKPVRTDRFGVVFEVPLVEGATSLNYILPQGRHQGPRAGPEPGPRPGSATRSGSSPARRGTCCRCSGDGEPGDLSTEQAQWLTEDVIAWDVDDARGRPTRCTPRPPAGSSSCPAGSTAASRSSSSSCPASLPAELAARFPHLKDYAALRVPEGLDVRAALKGALAVSAVRGDARQDATGVQIPNVLDDLYAAGAKGAELGVSFDGDVPTLRLWAPTARSVTLHRFADPAAAPPGQTTPMVPRRRDRRLVGDRRGRLGPAVLPVRGRGLRADHRQVERNVVTDPYSVSLATNSVKSQIVRLSDADLQPQGWAAAGTVGPATPEELQIYELHVRDFSIRDETVPEALRGTYKAFTQAGSDGMSTCRACRGGPDDGAPAADVRHRHDRGGPREAGRPAGPRRRPGLAAPAGGRARGRRRGRLQLGLRPVPLQRPEGSYATDPQGTTRIASTARWCSRSSRPTWAWSWTSSTTTPRRPGRARSRCSTRWCRATTTACSRTARSRPARAARTPPPSTR